jgi:hypothetical protein
MNQNVKILSVAAAIAVLEKGYKNWQIFFILHEVIPFKTKNAIFYILDV